MPTYEFVCTDCKHQFVVIETFDEHDSHKEKCPECESPNVEQKLSHVSVKTSRKS